MDPTVDLFSTITLYMPIVECNKLAVTRDTLHMSFQATNAIVKTTIHLILHIIIHRLLPTIAKLRGEWEMPHEEQKR